MPPPDALAAWPEWWPEAVLWIGVLVAACAAVAAAAAWTLVRRLDTLRGELAALGELHELQRSLRGWLDARDDLDLRRIEHLLIDLRDGSKRVEELLLRAEEARALASTALVPAGASGASGLGERIVSRLHSLGYERIEIVTPSRQLEDFAHDGGEVLVEARREGVACKGRVRVRAGNIEAVQLQPAFPIFP